MGKTWYVTPWRWELVTDLPKPFWAYTGMDHRDLGYVRMVGSEYWVYSRHKLRNARSTDTWGSLEPDYVVLSVDAANMVLAILAGETR